MRDPSPYAGQTVKLRPDAAELGGHPAEVTDWWNNAKTKLVAAAVDFKIQDYTVRGGTIDDQMLYARVDGMMRIIHATEIDGYAPPIEDMQLVPVEARDLGAICPACEQPIEARQMVRILVLGPGADPEARAAARKKRPYSAAAIEVHWPCATGDEQYEGKR